MKEEAAAARSLLLANWHKMAALTVAEPAANQVEIENLVDANRELTETVFTLEKVAFDYSKKFFHKSWR